MKWVQQLVVSDLDDEPGCIDMDTEYWMFKERLSHIHNNQCLPKLCMHEIVCAHSPLASSVL